MGYAMANAFLGERTMAQPPPRAIADEDKYAARMIERALAKFGEAAGPNVASHLVGPRLFLLAAANENAGVLELSRMAGVAHTVGSRYVLDYGDRDRYMQPGMGLLTTHVDPENLRKKEVRLTPRGRAVFHELLVNMRAALRRSN